MRITDRVHAIKIPFRIRTPAGSIRRFVYVYLIYGRKIYLIDSGVAAAGPLIARYIRATGRDVHDIALVVLTHAHPDHIGALHVIKEETGCACAVHKAEVRWVEDVATQYKERPVPGFHELVAGSVPVDRRLSDGDILVPEKGISLCVLHTPGHSSGSISLFFPEEKVLFTGDALIRPGDMPLYDDFRQMIGSIKALQGIVGVRTLLSSWDRPRTGRGVSRSIEESLTYLRRIHRAVKATGKKETVSDPLVFCKKTLTRLRLSARLANPLVARALLSTAASGDEKDIF